MIQSKRAKFYSTYISGQNFALPGTIMYYIRMNPKTAALYQKLIKSCKYFFVKNSILIVKGLFHYSDDEWFVDRKPFDLSKLECKLWITDELVVTPKTSVKAGNQSILSSLMPKLYRCDAKYLHLYDQVITFRDLSLLISSADDISFYDATIKNENGSNVALEKVIEIAVKAKSIVISSNNVLTNITSKTFTELLKIPHFRQIDYCCIEDIPDIFDIEAFYTYMKKNKTTKFNLGFVRSISDAYKARLEEIVDEILATEVFNYKPPLFDFLGLYLGKYMQLLRCSKKFV
uniref:Uncharacterized protein n=1 Tax=Panagrolaimus davidi TaxID=227884 RepID=A0A914PCK0_9BILA